MNREILFLSQSFDSHTFTSDTVGGHTDFTKEARPEDFTIFIQSHQFTIINGVLVLLLGGGSRYFADPAVLSDLGVRLVGGNGRLDGDFSGEDGIVLVEADDVLRGVGDVSFGENFAKVSFHEQANIFIQHFVIGVAE